ncbi:M20 family metallopeptidase, partial [Planococcus sp. CAU13]|uniref:M20 family metallopeptidase n=1 Tax=Planococcus sp. CAU13 TaxID=1541197 RepID=UPI00052FFAC8
MEWMKQRHGEMIELLEQLVNTDSGSTDKEGIDRVGDILKGHYEAIGFVVEKIENEKNGNHLLFRQPDATEPKILLLGHMDTVFAKGTAAKRPFRREDGRAYGPGVADMKGSQVTLLFAMKYLAEHDPAALRNVIVLLNSDEEIGSPTSCELIEETARPVDYALVMEPARKDGSLVSSRRGGGHYEMHVQGRASHSGGAPEEGISAIEELAHKIIKLNALSDHANGVSVSVGIIEGGEAVNMIPDRATGYIDVRVNT